ncbi:MAG: hypothetical protein KDD53_01370 [Bdellovibrionales bacterium]|nr:hypothetical protein [Bdellovibrionales bacterium]
MNRRCFISRFILIFPFLLGGCKTSSDLNSEKDPTSDHGLKNLTSQLQTRLSYLNVSQKELNAYLAEYLERQKDPNRILALFKSENINSKERNLVLINQIIDKMSLQFLNSSDFFHSGADESIEVHYIRWHDPYEHPCANPFADLS